MYVCMCADGHHDVIVRQRVVHHQRLTNKLYDNDTYCSILRVAVLSYNIIAYHCVVSYNIIDLHHRRLDGLPVDLLLATELLPDSR